MNGTTTEVDAHGIQYQSGELFISFQESLKTSTNKVSHRELQRRSIPYKDISRERGKLKHSGSDPRDKGGIGGKVGVRPVAGSRLVGDNKDDEGSSWLGFIASSSDENQD